MNRKNDERCALYLTGYFSVIFMLCLMSACFTKEKKNLEKHRIMCVAVRPILHKGHK